MNNFYEKYTNYLQSEEWQKKRQKRLAIDNFTCQFCGSHGSEIHHLTYRHVFSENPYTDLVTCCRNCHTLIHNGMNRITAPDGRRGWSAELPYHIRQNLHARGLM